VATGLTGFSKKLAPQTNIPTHDDILREGRSRLEMVTPFSSSVLRRGGDGIGAGRDSCWAADCGLSCFALGLGKGSVSGVLEEDDKSGV